MGRSDGERNFTFYFITEKSGHMLQETLCLAGSHEIYEQI